MTRSEREQLIERYLREELTPSEEQDFFIEAATDKELRFDLKASRVLENAFRKDRAAAPSSYAPMRNHLAEILAGSRPEQASHEEKSEPAARKSGPVSPFGWIVAATLIGLVSLTSLLIGIVAIEGDREEATIDRPAVIDGNARNRENELPQSFRTNRETIEKSTGTASSEENSDPGIVDRRESQSAPSSDNRESRATDGERQPEEARRSMHPPTTWGGPNPENVPVDTTDPDKQIKIQFEGPKQ